MSPQIPDGEDIPDNIMIWGLPKKSSLEPDSPSYSGSPQNLEIRHTAPQTARVRSVGSGGAGDQLLTLEEVDFLPPVTEEEGEEEEEEEESSPHLHQVILSREELDRRLTQLQQQQQQVETREEDLSNKIGILEHQQKNESEFYKKLFLSLMTSKEKQTDYKID